jgi:hypothetical protein
MPHQISSLQIAGAGMGTPTPSSMAFGLNAGTVLDAQNHWREYYNPLRALDIPRAITLWDESRRGLNAELQNCYREMEQLYPTLLGLIERRTSPLAEMDTKFSILPEDKWSPDASQSLAEDQVAALRQAYSRIDNLYEAIDWMEMASFRGFSHLEKIYANPGTTDFTICHLEPVEQWHFTRKSMYAEWEYVAAATQTNLGIPIEASQWLIREVPRPLNRVALILWIRANLCEKDWDAFIEIVGIPRWIVIMPPNVPPEKEATYKNAARSIANGGGGALPNGAAAVSADAPDNSGGDVFRPRLDWIQEQLVLAGTGGLLSMLAMPTGMNDSQGSQHADAFRQISVKEASRISKVFNVQFDAPILDDQFPGLPKLARFQLSAKEICNAADFVAGVLKLSQAGYMTNPEQITRKTGYKVTLKQQPPASPGGEPLVVNRVPRAMLFGPSVPIKQ